MAFHRRGSRFRPLVWEPLETRALLAVFHPLSFVLDGSTDSLRAAIVAANSNGEDDTIILEPDIYGLTVANSSGQENAAAKGDLDLTEANHTITIQGQGAGLSVIDGATDRIFHVFADVNFVLGNVSLRDGVALDDGSDGAAPGSTTLALGGGILGEVGSNMTLTNVAVEKNSAVGLADVNAFGGGIYTNGVLVLNDCLIDGNSASAGTGTTNGGSAGGGGILGNTLSSLTISHSTLSNNFARGGNATGSGIGGAAQGAGLFADTLVNISNSRLTGNKAIGGSGAGGGIGGLARGGGLFVISDSTLTDAVIAANEARGGSGAAGATPGGTGAAGGPAQGGGVYVISGTSLASTRTTYASNLALGGIGGAGGASSTASTGGRGAIGGIGEGGGLFVEGTATLTRDVVFNNQALGGGGGRGGQGTSSFGPGGTGNTGQGGGIATDGGTVTTVTIVSTTVSTNSAFGGNGAPDLRGRGNGIAQGGGVCVSSTSSTLNLKNSTIALNQVLGNLNSTGGGIFDSGTVNAVSTIIGDNSGTLSPDYSGAFDTATHVLLEDGTGATGITDGTNGNIVGQDPLLGPLANNGGATKTHLPLLGSPALNNGVNPLGLKTDQRGLARAVQAVDIGAVEFQAPRVALGGTVTFVENGPSIVLAAGATVSDTDNPDFNGGNLTVTITNNADANDLLQIKNQGTGAGQIGVSNGDVTFGGTRFGTFTGGTGSTPLVITFFRGPAPNVAQALVRAITFRTVTDNPSTAPRSIQFVINDGDGFASNPATATKTVKVKAVNDPPKLVGGGSIGYKLNATPVVLLPNAGVSDVDSTDFSGGRLTVHFTAGANSSNAVGLSGVFSVDANDNVLQGTTVIGVRKQSGVGTSDLIIVFNANATPLVVRDLIRSITFKATVSTAQRVLAFTVTDGDGGVSNTISKTINATP